MGVLEPVCRTCSWCTEAAKTGVGRCLLTGGLWSLALAWPIRVYAGGRPCASVQSACNESPQHCCLSHLRSQAASSAFTPATGASPGPCPSGCCHTCWPSHSAVRSPPHPRRAVPATTVTQLADPLGTPGGDQHSTAQHTLQPRQAPVSWPGHRQRRGPGQGAGQHQHQARDGGPEQGEGTRPPQPQHPAA